MSAQTQDRRGFPLEQPVVRDAQSVALDYVRWHAAAYGAPAPTNEIAAELHVPVSKARVLLRRMETDGKLVSQPDRYPSGGWHEPLHNAAFTGKPAEGEA